MLVICFDFLPASQCIVAFAVALAIAVAGLLTLT